MRHPRRQLLSGVWNLTPHYWFLAGLWLVCLFWVPVPLLANTCSTRGTEPIRIGFTLPYGKTVKQLPEQISLPGSTHTTCVSYAVGNEYQVLDWLENGKVDAAVLGPFALALLVGATPNRGAKPDLMAEFEVSFFASQRWPFPLGEIRRFRTGLRWWHDGAWQIEPETGLRNWLHSSQNEVGTTIAIPSHLSSALPALFHYADQIYSGSISPTERQDRWKSLLEALSFRVTDPEALRPSEGFHLVEISETECARRDTFCLPLAEGLALQDFVVVRAYAASDLYPNERQAALGPLLSFFDPFSTFSPVAGEVLVGPASRPSRALDASVREFFRSNFELIKRGPRKQRNYRFRVDELWNILREDEHRGNLAVVLTGGGVKAAYQTEIVHKLYENKYLSNVEERLDPELGHATLRVNHVVGTSGGAMLGLFVAALGRATPDLPELLWKVSTKGGGSRFLDASDLFPYIDLLRWLSVVVSGLVFGIVCFLMRGVVFRLGGIPPHQSPETGSRKWVSFSWVLVLLAAPLVIKTLNGENGELHVPAEAGLTYVFLLWMAIYSDNCLAWRKRIDWTSLTYRPGILVSLTVGLLLAVVVPWFFEPESVPAHPSLRITLRALISGVGWLLVSIGLHFFWRSQTNFQDGGYVQTSFQRFRECVFILFAIPAVTYLALYVLQLANKVSLFEMTASFILGTLIVAFLVSVLLIFISLRFRGRFIQRGVEFLYMHPPCDTLGGHLRRYQRVLLFLTMGWVWWNFAIAPGLYGNELARDYLRCAYQRFRGGVCGKGPIREKTGLTLQTHFVVPVTSLETRREIYFLFEPAKPLGDMHRHEHFELETRRRVFSDPRWRILLPAEQTADLLVDIPFASGSPFPVFPPIRVEGLPEGSDRLVDGGYAHNIPTEAARALGARQILIFRSSPLEAEQSLANVAFGAVRGNLVHNLPRLLPYLFDRSQIEDYLSTEGLLVVSIAPLERESWPWLTDFRQDTVKDLIRDAKADFSKRIGVVESWGNPRFCASSNRELSSLRGSTQCKGEGRS